MLCASVSKKYLDKNVALKNYVKWILDKFLAIKSKLLYRINGAGVNNGKYIPLFDKETENIFQQLMQGREAIIWVVMEEDDVVDVKRILPMYIGNRKIIQLVPSLNRGDAVGNEVLAIDGLLKASGVNSGVYVLNYSVKTSEFCEEYTKLPELGPDDVIIYHFAIGCRLLTDRLKSLACKKVMIYHNITPGDFFKEYNEDLVELVDSGRRELADLKNVFDYCMADSEYNKEELQELGYRQRIDVLPLLVPFDDYDQGMDVSMLEKYAGDGWTNLLFVGRIAPNKKQEDVIRAYAYYKYHYNPKSRLILVGNSAGMELYYHRLVDYVAEMGVEDVIFTQHIGFDAILSFYNLADVFLCMSEHEGFCVPLIEAMYFDLPIVAYKSSAIPWVLGGSGVLVEEKNPLEIAGKINQLVCDKEIRNAVIAGQRKRLEDFSYDKTSALFMQYMQSFLGE